MSVVQFWWGWGHIHLSSSQVEGGWSAYWDLMNSPAKPKQVCVPPQVPSFLTGEPTLVFQIAYWSFLIYIYNKNDDTAYDTQVYTWTPSAHMGIISGTSISRTLHCSAPSKTLHPRHWPTGDMSLTKINSPRVPTVYQSGTECFMHHDPPPIEKLLPSLYYRRCNREQRGETTRPSSPDVKQSRDGLLDPLYSWGSDTIRNTVLNSVSAFQDGCC